MRRITALARSLVLLTLALAGPVVFLVVIVFGLCLVLPAPTVIVQSRRLPRLARRLAGGSSEGVYWPPLVPTAPGGRAVQSRQQARGQPWCTSSNVAWTGRPTTRAPAGLDLDAHQPVRRRHPRGLGPRLGRLGVWLSFTSWWPAGIVLAVAGVGAAPDLVALHDRWTNVMLQAKHDGRAFRFWAAVRRGIKQWWHATVLSLLATPAWWSRCSPC